MSIVLVIFIVIDFLSSEWIKEVNLKHDTWRSVPFFIAKILLVILCQICKINNKTGVHEHAAMVLLICLILIPSFYYLIGVSKP